MNHNAIYLSSRRVNWAALSNWLRGICDTLSVFPYIAHLHPLKVKEWRLVFIFSNITFRPSPKSACGSWPEIRAMTKVSVNQSVCDPSS